MHCYCLSFASLRRISNTELPDCTTCSRPPSDPLPVQDPSYADSLSHAEATHIVSCCGHSQSFPDIEFLSLIRFRLVAWSNLFGQLPFIAIGMMNGQSDFVPTSDLQSTSAVALIPLFRVCPLGIPSCVRYMCGASLDTCQLSYIPPIRQVKQKLAIIFSVSLYRPPCQRTFVDNHTVAYVKVHIGKLQFVINTWYKGEDSSETSVAVRLIRRWPALSRPKRPSAMPNSIGIAYTAHQKRFPVKV